MKLLTPAQIKTIVASIGTAGGAGVVVLVYLGLSQDDASAIGAAIKQIGEGLGAIAMGVGTLVTVGSTIYATIQQSRKNQVAAVATPGTVVKIPEQHIADELPRNVVGPKDDLPYDIGG
jgi:hypothetical protein